MTSHCIICDRPIIYFGGSWRHIEGGGLHWQKCRECDWEGSGVEKCPKCGSVNIADDHCVCLKVF